MGTLGYQLNFQHLISTRAKICDGVDGYNASGDYWLQCLYDRERVPQEHASREGTGTLPLCSSS